MANLITPPPELVQQWAENWHSTPGLLDCRYEYIATQAAQWGADRELEACCEWLSGCGCESYGRELRAARRPKPPSLKEQAQVELDRLIALIPSEGALAMAEPIRRALEALPND
jgi:hypothetical protein